MSDDQLARHRRSVYSQFGEDGVIAEINRRLGNVRGWFCEFGAWDGRHGSNTYLLLRQGWSGVMIEADGERYRRLERNAAKYPHLHAICRTVTESGQDSLDAILAATPIPHDFDVLSIDVDGADYQIWRSLSSYRPGVVIVEIASQFPPGVRRIHGEDGAKMTSFTPMLELGERKGYRLACHTGNMIFVREDLTARLALDLRNPAALYDVGYLDQSRSACTRRKLRNLSRQRLGMKIEDAARTRFASRRRA